MPERHVHWSCSKCHQWFVSFDDASQCKGQHIVDDALAGFRAELAEIFKDTPKARAALRTPAGEDAGEAGK